MSTYMETDREYSWKVQRIQGICIVRENVRHIVCMDDNAGAKRILLASPLGDWRRQPGSACITLLSTIQQDLRHHHRKLPEGVDIAQDRPLWRMLLTYGTMQS